MRIRTVKPEFWPHPVMARQEDAVRLAAIGLLNIADDEGYFIAEPAIVRAAIWPFDEDSSRTRRALAQLTVLGWIEQREHPTQGKVGRVVNFTKHQRIDRPTSSKLKTYFLDESSTSTRRALDEPSSLEQGTGNREQGNREQGAGRTVGGASPASKTAKLSDEEWLLQLSADPTYDGIDVHREHGKMLRWCQLHQKHPTRRRFLNWLNRAERPMGGKAPNEQHPNDRHLGGGDLWDATAPGGEDDVPV